MMSTLRPLIARSLQAAVIAAALVAPAFAASYEIDPTHTSAVFNIIHLGFSKVQGAIKELSGTFTFDEAKPEQSAIAVKAKAASIDTFNEARDKHLRGADFFDVEKYPTLEFKSKSWKKTGDKAYDVTGDFTLHGVTKSITVPVTLVGMGKGMKGEERAGFSASFKIKRSEFGMNQMLGSTMIGDEVTIEVSTEGVKK